MHESTSTQVVFSCPQRPARYQVQGRRTHGVYHFSWQLVCSFCVPLLSPICFPFKTMIYQLTFFRTQEPKSTRWLSSRQSQVQRFGHARRAIYFDQLRGNRDAQPQFECMSRWVLPSYGVRLGLQRSSLYDERCYG